MARECRRKREARRFGVPVRLADWAAELPWRKPFFAEGWDAETDRTWEDLISECRNSIRDSVVVDAADVGEYFYAETPKDVWDYRTDFPSCLPPFPLMLLEFRRPSRILVEGTSTGADHIPPSFGWLFNTQSRDEYICELTDQTARAKVRAALGRKIERILPMVDRAVLASLDLSKSPGELLPTVGPIEQTFLSTYIHYLRLNSSEMILPDESIRWMVRADLIFRADHAAIIGPIVSVGYQLDDRGQVIGTMIFSPMLDINRQDYEREALELRDFGQSILYPALLAISFMHCKRGVGLPVSEPDPAINAARVRAGKLPFVRYRTIVIGPMKEVLRSEGGSDKHGLRRALHVVRGNFATYTEDRPLFGRVVGTIWRPAHVRGIEEEGIVVSDYRVGRPGDAGAVTKGQSR